MPNYTGNKTIYLNYLPPNITQFEPNSVDTQGQEVTIHGDNFGNVVDNRLGLMGNVELPIPRDSFIHTSFIVYVPPGEGKPKEVVITVDKQELAGDAS